MIDTHRYPTETERIAQALKLLRDYDGHDEDCSCQLCTAIGVLMGTTVYLIRTAHKNECIQCGEDYTCRVECASEDNGLCYDCDIKTPTTQEKTA